VRDCQEYIPQVFEIGCGSFWTTAKLQKTRLFRKFADLTQVSLPEIWLLKRHISMLPVVP
jgi:hypothetical protein